MRSCCICGHFWRQHGIEPALSCRCHGISQQYQNHSKQCGIPNHTVSSSCGFHGLDTSMSLYRASIYIYIYAWGDFIIVRFSCVIKSGCILLVDPTLPYYKHTVLFVICWGLENREHHAELQSSRGTMVINVDGDYGVVSLCHPWKSWLYWLLMEVHILNMLDDLF